MSNVSFVCRAMNAKPVNGYDREINHVTANLRQYPISNMNVHNKWSVISPYSPPSKLRALSTASTTKNSSEAGSSRNVSPTNISSTWSHSSRDFFDFNNDEEFVQRRRGETIYSTECFTNNIPSLISPNYKSTVLSFRQQCGKEDNKI